MLLEFAPGIFGCCLLAQNAVDEGAHFLVLGSTSGCLVDCNSTDNYIEECFCLSARLITFESPKASKFTSSICMDSRIGALFFVNEMQVFSFCLPLQ